MHHDVFVMTDMQMSDICSMIASSSTHSSALLLLGCHMMTPLRMVSI
jgi:hypothetical protein